MAKLSTHGAEIDRREYPGCRTAVMSDGWILRDYGYGWQRHGKVKPGQDPAAYAAECRQCYEARPTSFHQYVDLLIAEFPKLLNRIRAHTIISLMPQDPDGVWAELGDFGQERDYETVRRLCDLYLRSRGGASEEIHA